jgi:hypothetical protein
MPIRRRSIVMLLGAPLGPACASAPTVEVWVELRQDLHGADLDVLARELQSLGALELARVRQPVPALAVRVDPSRLEAIRQLPTVARVRPARVLHPPTPGSGPRTR